MKYWVFIVTQQKENGNIVSGREILKTRFKDGFWGLGERTPNRKNLEAGDKVVFYEGNPTKSFVARATLKSRSFQLSAEESIKFSHHRGLYIAEYGVYLDEIHLFENPIPAEKIIEFLPSLRIKNTGTHISREEHERYSRRITWQLVKRGPQHLLNK